jgi:tRNA (cmo5U34)-methyltransferase
MTRDSYYAVPHELLADFAFDESVTRVFPDMIRRSVPGYGNIVTMIGLLADRYGVAGSTLYDLGCSLGASTLSMRRCLGSRDCTIVAVDNSAAMVEGCKANIAAAGEGVAVDVRCEDIRDVTFNNASVVVLNFTLQFIPPEHRLELLHKIRSGMRPGGVFVLSEKLVFDSPEEDEFQRTLHLDFKRANGYSELEISQKRTALENVLIPDTLQQHRQRLADAGFARSHLWFQCFNFASIIAFA